MKKGILIEAFDNKRWVGGLYYKRNILFSLTQNTVIMSKYNIVVITYMENKEVFEDFDDVVTIKYIGSENYRVTQIKELLLCFIYHCKFIFPCENIHYRWLGIRIITWFPDFQHNRLPMFFSKQEIHEKTVRVNNIVNNNVSLILSSNDCLNDFRKFYSSEYRKIQVVPFVSYIEPVINNISEDEEKETLVKFELHGKKYACVMNQFWQHKNHIIVFEALARYFEKNPESNYIFVLTGNMEDYRNPEYIHKLKAMLEKSCIKEHVRILGFIEREEQIIIMKNAEYLIQPSLFEGWGTVLEDAKVLDKTVLLSDISVHQEQRSEKCKMFNPYDANALADMIEIENRLEHTDNIQKGISNMRARAMEYSKGFEKMLDLGEI